MLQSIKFSLCVVLMAVAYASAQLLPEDGEPNPRLDYLQNLIEEQQAKTSSLEDRLTLDQEKISALELKLASAETKMDEIVQKLTGFQSQNSGLDWGSSNFTNMLFAGGMPDLGSQWNSTRTAIANRTEEVLETLITSFNEQLSAFNEMAGRFGSKADEQKDAVELALTPDSTDSTKSPIDDMMARAAGPIAVGKKLNKILFG